MDYKALLEKYMHHVLLCEGTTFVRDAWPSIDFMTEEDVAELRRIDDSIAAEGRAL
jgi:hypothetical protein